MTQTGIDRLHIVEGTDWKDAVIALLESRSPYRPWRYGFGEAHEGDPVAIVLNTDPPSVMTALGRIGSDGQPDRAVVDWPSPAPGLIELTTLVMMVGFESDQDPRDTWQLHREAANRMELALTECQFRHDSSMRFGHSSLTAARVLLRSNGRCTGCSRGIDLTGEEAREAIQIRTVDRPSRVAPEVLVKDEREPAATGTHRFPPTAGRRTYPPTGPACCAVAAIPGCTRVDSPICSTSAFHRIRNARTAERVGPRVPRSACLFRKPCTETFRRGLIGEDASGLTTSGPAQRARTRGGNPFPGACDRLRTFCAESA